MNSWWGKCGAHIFVLWVRASLEEGRGAWKEKSEWARRRPGEAMGPGVGLRFRKEPALKRKEASRVQEE